MSMPVHFYYPKANALFERWFGFIHRRADLLAIRDLGSGANLDWEDVIALLDKFALPPALPAAPDLIPLDARGIDFVVGVLAIWRAGKVVLPLEPGTTPPAAWLTSSKFLPPLPKDCAVVKLTSGSTGTPRGVAFTCAQIAADADHLVAAMGMNMDAPNLCAISLAHSYGFSNLVTPLLLHGIPLILMESPLPEPMRRGLETVGKLHRKCVLPAVPALWSLWQRAEIFAASKGPVSFGISAGAPLPLEMERASTVRIHNFYGASECGGIAYYKGSAPREEATLAGSIIPNVEVSVNPQGLLQVRGPAVGECYWPEPGPNLAHGVYTSSDLAEIRGDDLHILGRAGEMIHIAGRKLMPQEVENVLRIHPQVAECLVFGVASRESTRQEEIVACICPATGAGTALEADLRGFLHERLPGWKLPRHWWLTPDLKPDARGKLSRDAWRKRFLHAFPGASS